MNPIVDPFLLNVPDEIHTDRLLIRAPRQNDALEMNRAIVESAAQLQPWMPWATPIPPLAETEQYCRRSAAKFLLREAFDYRIHLKDGGAFAGNIGIQSIEWKVPRVEIGYWLRTTMFGRGYMTEAVNAITLFSLQTLCAVRVEIKTDDANQQSRRVAERAGFILEGIIRNDERRPDGSLRDTRIYAKIKSR